MYWTPLFWPEIGGIEVMAMKTLPALRDRGHEFVVVASHGRSKQPDLTDHKGIPVYRFPIWSALVQNDLRQLFRIRAEIDRLKEAFKPGLIHINFSGHMAYFQLVSATSHPAPTLVKLYGSLAGSKAGRSTVLGQLLRAADWIVGVSEATLNEAREIMPEIGIRSSVIYDCQETPGIDPSPLPFDTPRILCLGRLVHEKGFDLAITAFASLLCRFPQLALTLAGNGPERARLEKQVDDLGLSARVEFTGRIDNSQVPELLNRATFVVIPSRCRDAFPIVAVEAAYMARPVVATNVGGLPEAVLDGKTGVLVKAEDAGDLAEGMAYLLQNREAAEQMGHAGRMRALHLFSMDRFVEEYDALYHNLMRGSSTQPAEE